MGGPCVPCSAMCHTLPWAGGPGGWLRSGEVPHRRELRLLHPLLAELDPGYRPMYSGDIPLDPIDMHMDMDGDYPMDAYSDGVRAPFADHMLA